MNFCNKCILSDSIFGSEFNEEGLCNLCEKYEPRKCLGEYELIKTVSKFKKNKKYDCIVPISGGKDSTFALYYAVKKLNLKSLAVNFNSGFRDDTAFTNMKLACEKLNVPLIIKNNDVMIQYALLKIALSISDDKYFFNPCGNCETLLRMTAINIAKENKIDLILWGGSDMEQMPNIFEIDEYSYIVSYIRKAKNKAYSIKNVIKYLVLNFYQRLKINTPLRYAIYPFMTVPASIDGITSISLFDYIEWNPIEQIDLLKKELDWNQVGEKNSRFDCLIHPLLNYNLFQRWEISSDGIILANMARHGIMTREDALKSEKQIQTKIEEEYHIILKMINDY
jgi:phosphopantetheinyl transferase (holo-ACP synthase)